VLILLHGGSDRLLLLVDEKSSDRRTGDGSPPRLLEIFGEGDIESSL
jgi:hypothetical protein